MFHHIIFPTSVGKRRELFANAVKTKVQVKLIYFNGSLLFLYYVHFVSSGPLTSDKTRASDDYNK